MGVYFLLRNGIFLSLKQQHIICYFFLGYLLANTRKEAKRKEKWVSFN